MNFFKYENQPFPPSLSNEGELYSTIKRDLIPILEEKIETSSYKPQSDCLIVDGSSLVSLLIVPYRNNLWKFCKRCVKKVDGFSDTHQRVNIEFDQYKPESLKSFARLQRTIFTFGRQHI